MMRLEDDSIAILQKGEEDFAGLWEATAQIRPAQQRVCTGSA